MHHPLLETVSLDRAAGVIANFTGGQDLTLSEVEEALTYLQSQTGVHTETVLGVINDDRMEDRVQVILVITGLGAPTLEETMSSVKKSETEPIKTAPAPEPIRESIGAARPVAPAHSSAHAAEIASGINQNLDIPAFMRRRTRYAG